MAGRKTLSEPPLLTETSWNVVQLLSWFKLESNRWMISWNIPLPLLCLFLSFLHCAYFWKHIKSVFLKVSQEDPFSCCCIFSCSAYYNFIKNLSISLQVIFGILYFSEKLQFINHYFSFVVAVIFKHLVFKDSHSQGKPIIGS